jgi:hypothetical protein
VTDQYPIHSVGGPMAPTSMFVHRACGAFIYDRRQHEKVCTAPPLEKPSHIGEVRDWNSI